MLCREQEAPRQALHSPPDAHGPAVAAGQHGLLQGGAGSVRLCHGVATGGSRVAVVAGSLLAGQLFSRGARVHLGGRVAGGKAQRSLRLA